MYIWDSAGGMGGRGMGVERRGTKRVCDLRHLNVFVLIIRVGRYLEIRVVIGGPKFVPKHYEEEDDSDFLETVTEPRQLERQRQLKRDKGFPRQV